MQDSQVTIRLKTGVVTRDPITITNKHETQYPSETIGVSKAKPRAVIHIGHGVANKEDLYIRSAVSQKPDIEIINYFLYKNLLERLRFRNDTEWSSYGITICRANEECTIGNILEVEVDDVGTTDAREETRVTALEKDGIFATLLAVSRLPEETELNRTYLAKIRLRMETLCKSVLKMEQFDDDVLTSRLLWRDNSTYKKLIAAFDMFCRRFEDHPYSKLKMCTVTSRLRDCGSFQTMNDFSDLMNMPFKDAVKFIYDDGVGSEMERILKPDIEYKNQDSYFYYFRDFEICKKSPYSSSENPRLHNWVYALGSLKKNQRSLSAKLFNPAGIEETINMCMFVAYVTRSSMKPTGVFLTDEEDRRVKETEARASLNVREEDLLTPVGILKSIILHDAIVPEEILDYYRNSFANLEVRSGTIAEAIKLKLA